MVFLGSCFAKTIGRKFQERKFTTTINPFGIIYNPVSLLKALELATSGKGNSNAITVQHHGLFHSYYHHGDLSADSEERLLANIQAADEQMLASIRSSKVLFITLGTAWAFRHNEYNQLVANCHKVPGSQFSRELLSIQQITSALVEIMDLVDKLNNKCEVVFTLSPVRHLRDGLVANNLGKAHLLASVHAVVNNNAKAHYFPSYELLLDDLRDYRFFDTDLSHPNQQAVDYIFDKLKQTLFDDFTLSTMSKVEKVTQAYQHRVQQIEVNSTKVFADKQLQTIRNLEQCLPPSAFANEIKYFQELAG